VRFYDINGIQMPSVTTILSALPTPTALRLFIENNPNAKFIAAERAFIGVMAHYHFECQNSIPLNRIAELEDVDEQFDTEENRIIIDDIKMKINFFLMENELKPIMLEEKLWSHELQIAGRVDFIGYVNGKMSILDLKTSKAFYESDTGFDNHSIQLSAYKICFEECKDLNISIDKLYILRCHENSWWEMREKKFDPDGVKYARELFMEKYGC